MLTLGPIAALMLFPSAPEQPVFTRCGSAELGEAECGTIDVPEGGRSTRRVRLDLLVLRSPAVARADDPLFVLQGGPGQAATPQADFYARVLAPIRRTRDIYLIDVRGTGRSDSLHCPAPAAEREFLPLAAVRACREALRRRVDLSAYNTRRIVADLEEVRRRLGLRRVNLYGTSYGTRVALEYMRLHPESVRTAALSGVIPAQNDAPASYGRFAQRVFARYVALCRAQPGCAAAYPDPAGDLEAALARLRRGEAGIPAGLFGELVRMELYGPGSAGRLFGALRQAAEGDFGFWRRRAQRMAGFWSADALSLGMFLSVTCADFMRADRALARRLGARTFAGTYRFDQQRAACAEWPVARTPFGFARPVRSTVPALLVAGELDPVTPPEWAATAARTLPRARLVIVRNNGHALGAAAGCVARMMTELIEREDPAAIDAGCADDLPPPDFAAD